MPGDSKTLIAKIESLPAERIAEIEDFVDLIHLREQEKALTSAAAAASAPAFAVVWSNPEDDVYDLYLRLSNSVSCCGRSAGSARKTGARCPESSRESSAD